MVVGRIGTNDASSEGSGIHEHRRRPCDARLGKLTQGSTTQQPHQRQLPVPKQQRPHQLLEPLMARASSRILGWNATIQSRHLGTCGSPSTSTTQRGPLARCREAKEGVLVAARRGTGQACHRPAHTTQQVDRPVVGGRQGHPAGGGWGDIISGSACAQWQTEP